MCLLILFKKQKIWFNVCLNSKSTIVDTALNNRFLKTESINNNRHDPQFDKFEVIDQYPIIWK